jgi:hypothetical protein
MFIYLYIDGFTSSHFARHLAGKLVNQATKRCGPL